MPDQTQTHAIQRLLAAAASLTALFDSGAFFEGYDGAEPQRSASIAATEELANATCYALQTLGDLLAEPHTDPTDPVATA